MATDSKIETYRTAHEQIAALLAGANDAIAAMAGVAAVLYDHLDSVSWVGFYRVVGPALLRIGPYQGPVGCQEIAFGSGVCGVAAAERKTQIVPDVHAFPGHIACDASSRSEIVVPVFDSRGEIAAVLDLDSHQSARFDELDKDHLEQIVELLRDPLTTSRPRRRVVEPNTTAPAD